MAQTSNHLSVLSKVLSYLDLAARVGETIPVAHVNAIATLVDALITELQNTIPSTAPAPAPVAMATGSDLVIMPTTPAPAPAPIVPVGSFQEFGNPAPGSPMAQTLEMAGKLPLGYNPVNPAGAIVKGWADFVAANYAVPAPAPAPAPIPITGPGEPSATGPGIPSNLPPSGIPGDGLGPFEHPH